MNNNDILKSVSLDVVSGIDTMVNNMNSSSNLLIQSAIIEPQIGPKNTIIVEDKLPSVVVTPINKQEKETRIDVISNKINNLSDDDKFKIIAGLLLISVTLLAFSIVLK